MTSLSLSVWSKISLFDVIIIRVFLHRLTLKCRCSGKQNNIPKVLATHTFISLVFFFFFIFIHFILFSSFRFVLLYEKYLFSVIRLKCSQQQDQNQIFHSFSIYISFRFFLFFPLVCFRGPFLWLRNFFLIYRSFFLS